MHGDTKRIRGLWVAASRMVLLLVFAVGNPAFAQSPTIRFMSWNILNYTLNGTATNGESSREPYMRTIISDIDPDVIAVVEVWSNAGSDRFLNNVLNVIAPGKWGKSLLQPSSTYDYQLYYRTDRNLTLGSTYFVQAPTRYLVRFEIRHTDGEVSDTLFAYVGHLKASDTSADEQTRTEQIQSVIDHMNRPLQPLAGRHVVFCGDFNLYRSSGTAWAAATTDGVFRDPVNRVGSWHANSAFADVHTQSTRNSYTGISDGGITGGLDDRFDFILASAALFDNTGLDYVPGSYHAYGNDGLHYNLSINDGQNDLIRSDVADALFYSSDHLPVVMDMYVSGTSGVVDKESPAIPISFRIVSVYPNPFNSTASVELNLDHSGSVDLALFDLLGRRVWEKQAGMLEAGVHRVTIHANNLPSGVYLLRSIFGASVDQKKITLIR